MSERGIKAKAYFESGYNCAQAVLMAFSDLTGIDEATSAKLASSFGGGIGRMREVCGTVSGMLMAYGLIRGYATVDSHEVKAEHYVHVRELADKFKAENGSIICRELLAGVQHTDGGDPEPRSAEYYKKRPCGELVECAADILDEYLSAGN